MEEYSHNLNWNDHSAVLLSKLHNMFEGLEFVDLTLASHEGLSIQVHRVIMCAASPYFKDLLSKHPGDAHITIILSDVSFEHLRALVEFIYKGTASVPRNQLPVLLESATLMKIKGLADAIKCSQHQQDPPDEVHPSESEATFLKIVSVKSIAQMPARSDELASLENSDVVVKEELGYDSDATVVYEPEENDWMRGSGATGLVMNEPRTSSLEDEESSPGRRYLNAVALKQQAEKHPVSLEFTVLGDNSPPAPIIFKRDPYMMTDEGKEQEENSHQNLQSEELVENGFDDDAESNEEEKSDDSTDEDYATASTSNNLKTKVNSSTEKERPKIIAETPFKCTKCQRSYKNRKSLIKHVKYSCDLVPRFQCTQCNHRFKRKSDLRKHLTDLHGICPSDFAAHGVGYTFQ